MFSLFLQIRTFKQVSHSTNCCSTKWNLKNCYKSGTLSFLDSLTDTTTRTTTTTTTLIQWPLFQDNLGKLVP